jgi:7-keto-8-aminopelargonate synthetase-like enzyme
MAIGARMRAGFQALGFRTGPSETPIVPVIIGDDQTTLLLWRALFEAGVYVNPVVPPAVAPNLSLLRTSYMATHTDEQLDRVLDIFGQVGRSLGVI